MNSLFDHVVISPQRPYSPYDQPGAPLELSPHTYQIPSCQLSSPMDSEGAIPTSPQDPLEFSAIHTPHVDEE